MIAEDSKTQLYIQKCDYSNETRTVTKEYIKWKISVDEQKIFFKYKNLLGYKQACKLFEL